MSPMVCFEHLDRLTTPIGLFEHALGPEPRLEHGFCVDDVARALVVTSRTVDATPDVHRLTGIYLDFVLDAITDDGLMHNRRGTDGAWTDIATSNDHWGRGLWALGTAATALADPSQAARARAGAAHALQARSHWPRAMAYAALGASLLLAHDPNDRAARRLLEEVSEALAPAGASSPWPWPEPRLTYANAVLPEAMIATGRALGDAGMRDDGLALLDWLVLEQTTGDHLSVVAASGRSPMDAGRRFAQQPIEVAALAEACRTAYEATGETRWLAVVDRALAWFGGSNDIGAVMHDPATGAGFDGLEAHGVNLNQGAESTLAWLSTAQIAAMPIAAVAQ
jgi:hypothetical protein